MNDVTSGRALRDIQLGLFEIRKSEFLERCREIAIAIARARGSVSINDIRDQVEIPPGTHPSVLGAVFKRGGFQVVGFTEATHPQAHARIVRIYSLKGGA